MRRRLVLVLVLAVVTLAVPWPAAATGPAVDDARIVHALNRLAFGPRPGDVERVRRIGLDAYIEEQLDPERIDDGALDAVLETIPAPRMSIAELKVMFPRPPPGANIDAAPLFDAKSRLPIDPTAADRRPARIIAELQAAKVLRAVESRRQLQEVMVDFWFNHFNVFARKGELRWYTAPYEREAIRPHVLGRFPDLVRATAQHPAMLFYLDNWLSTRADFVIAAGRNRGKTAGLNENYARELLELHTLGVDGGYTQRDVTEVARAFTGWTIDRPQIEGRFIFRPRTHDRGEKVVLGRRLRAGGDKEDGDQVIDILVRHPSTARFIATKLVRRFVADEPPPALVARVAATYARTGGDISAMLRTIVAAPEFWADEARAAKIKTPFEYVASAARALAARVDGRGGFVLARASAQMGEALYDAQPPTGYADRAEQWVNAGALLARMNFALALVDGRLPGVRADLAGVVGSVDRSRAAAVLDRLLATLVHGRGSAATRAVLEAQLEEPQIIRRTADDGGAADTDVEKLAALVIGSPDFQRR